VSSQEQQQEKIKELLINFLKENNVIASCVTYFVWCNKYEVSIFNINKTPLCIKLRKLGHKAHYDLGSNPQCIKNPKEQYLRDLFQHNQKEAELDQIAYNLKKMMESNDFNHPIIQGEIIL
jgi:hypothetical protein